MRVAVICCRCPIWEDLEGCVGQMAEEPLASPGEAVDGEATGSNQFPSLPAAYTGQCKLCNLYTSAQITNDCCQTATRAVSHSWFTCPYLICQTLSHRVLLSTFQLLFLESNSFILWSCLQCTIFFFEKELIFKVIEILCSNWEWSKPRKEEKITVIQTAQLLFCGKT